MSDEMTMAGTTAAQTRYDAYQQEHDALEQRLVQPAGIMQRVPRAAVSRTWRSTWFSYRSTESVWDDN